VTGDDDIAASLPKPPLPAPARREAAMKEALRRFDGDEARSAGDRRPEGPKLWWSRPSRPYAGALAGAFLVALVGLPLAWSSFDEYVEDGRGERPSGIEAGDPALADADGAQAESAPAERKPAAAADKVERAAPAKLAQAAAPSLPDPATARSEEPAAEAGTGDSGEIVVTGSRIRNPNLESAVPITVVGGEEFSLRDRQSARAARRGDWNACTVEDPGRSLESCRSSLGTVSRGARGRAAAPLADGLSRAWTGDVEGAMTAFDRAIELSPRSSSAYLNRGLAWRRRGDLDRALADLDRAVLYAPGDARAYYHRGLVLRQRGDLRRARADESRAVELDPRYAPLVRTR
jgi:tetratricopeptide (TPR) repeat protein